MDNSDDDIRSPDKIQVEQLLYDRDDRDNFEKEMDEVIKLSIEEMTNNIYKNEDYEKQVINDYEKEMMERRTTFSELLKVLIKLSKYDNEIKDIYDIIEPIIESYCAQFISECELDGETCRRIFKVLDTIRIDRNIIEKLKTIIVSSSSNS